MSLPFCAKAGSNVAVTPAAASASTSIDAGNTSVRLVNTGANVCYVRFGSGSATATTADIPVRAASESVVRKEEGQDFIAYISAAGTTLNIQTGDGGE